MWPFGGLHESSLTENAHRVAGRRRLVSSCYPTVLCIYRLPSAWLPDPGVRLRFQSIDCGGESTIRYAGCSASSGRRLVEACDGSWRPNPRVRCKPRRRNPEPCRMLDDSVPSYRAWMPKRGETWKRRGCMVFPLRPGKRRNSKTITTPRCCCCCCCNPRALIVCRL